LPVPVPEAQPVTVLDEKHAELRAAIREVPRGNRRQYRGCRQTIPEQARKMHEGRDAVRSIRGEATLEEAKELWRRALPVLPVPPLPEDRN
jgi:hypothetical protein